LTDVEAGLDAARLVLDPVVTDGRLIKGFRDVLLGLVWVSSGIWILSTGAFYSEAWSFLFLSELMVFLTFWL
jgi:hypothetical protein